MRLADLASALQVEFRGDADYQVHAVSSLETAQAHQLTFVAGSKRVAQLASCHAGVVVLSSTLADVWPGNLLLSSNPHLTFAHAAGLLHPARCAPATIHPTAVIHPSAQLAADVSVGAYVVIGEQVSIGSGTSIGAGSVVEHSVQMGRDCRIGPNVTIMHDCLLGARVHVESGAVIGAEGFGFAKDGDAWVRVPQIGKVVIGDDVEIGANTCIDRGAIQDTVIANGVKLDNLIHVAHNVYVGEHTAMAAKVGIAGSTRIGARCTIAGKVGIAGHLNIADDVHVTAMSMISHDLPQPGVYSGAIPQDTNANWRKNAARFRQLDAMARRLRALEKQINTGEDDATDRDSD